MKNQCWKRVVIYLNILYFPKKFYNILHIYFYHIITYTVHHYKYILNLK